MQSRLARLIALALLVPWLAAPADDATSPPSRPVLSGVQPIGDVAADADAQEIADAGVEPTLDALLGGRVRTPLASLAERVRLAPDEEFRVAEIGRDAGTSHHAVAIRNAEVPHRHDRHDLFVVMVSGYGTWLAGDQTRPVGEGSILYVPRGTVHAFSNESRAPAIAYAVYTPPFDGVDRVDAEAPPMRPPPAVQGILD